MSQSIFSMLYESMEIGIYPVQEYFEFTNIKAFKAFFSKTKKAAQEYTKIANSLFRRGEYKDAKKNYQEAVKKWTEVSNSIKKVEEKEPGWFKSDNLVYFVPFVNVVAMLILAYAESSAIRYIPKFVARDNNANKGKEYQSGSLTKADLVSMINEVISYCEFQIKACDKPDGIALAESINDMLESYGSLMESTENLLTNYEMFQ